MTPIAMIHASAAAIPPLMQFYSREAPEFEITNLLDDGVLRYFAACDAASAEARLREMIATATGRYGARAVLVTCSALTGATMDALRISAAVPVIRIDEPMARRAATSGSRIGVLVTFPPAAEPARRLLLDAAGDRNPELLVRVCPEAYDALLSGDAATHDRLLLAALADLTAQSPACIVLAQVSMARILDRIPAESGVPVFSSLETSLESIRSVLEAS